jgi:hypothetical protein
MPHEGGTPLRDNLSRRRMTTSRRRMPQEGGTPLRDNLSI